MQGEVLCGFTCHSFIPCRCACGSVPSSTSRLVLVLVVPIVLCVKDQSQGVQHVAGHWIVLHPGGEQLDEELAHEEDPFLDLRLPPVSRMGGQQLAKRLWHNLKNKGDFKAC